MPKAELLIAAPDTQMASQELRSRLYIEETLKLASSVNVAFETRALTHKHEAEARLCALKPVDIDSSLKVVACVNGGVNIASVMH